MEYSRIIIIILLIVLSAFFSASETALTGVNRIRLKNKAENGSSAAKKALKLIGRYDRMLATLLVGNNAVNLAASAISTLFAVQLAESSGFKAESGVTVAVVTVIITLIIIIFGEILPKTLAKEHAESFVLATAGPLTAFMMILTPVSVGFLLMQRGFSRLFRKKDKEVSVTEEELLHIIDEIEGEGVLEEHESDLVRSALEFDETTVGEVLTPRVDMTAVALTDSVEKIRDVFLGEGFSRLPVYDETPDKVIGLISNKEFMKRLLTDDDLQVRDILKDIVRLPALMKLSEALKCLQREKSHLAVVLDQHGGTEGIVTMEDILEELVGEIWDESDEEKHPIRLVSKTVFEVKGELSVNDFNRFFEDLNDDSGEYGDVEIDSDSNTVGGWAFELFGKIPEEGESVTNERFKVTVLNMNGRRIGKVQLIMIKESKE